jgi:hypothetical protein
MNISSFRDFSIGVFFLVISAVVVIAYVQLKPTIETYASAKAEIEKGRFADFNAMQSSVAIAIDSYTAGIEDDRANRTAMIEHAKTTSAFVEDVAVLISARLLEQEDVLSPATADELARESINNIKIGRSERIGRLLEALNDYSLRNRD